MAAKITRIRPSPQQRATGPGGRKHMALPDVPDVRDLPYQPMLRPLPPARHPPRDLVILDQGKEGACTGYALAAVINLLASRNYLSGHDAPQDPAERRLVSPQMLYTMARRYDEWPGDKYEGSSLRGALRGFFNNGACSADLWRKPGDREFSLQTAKDARNTTLGAYYRLRPVLSDYHAAINETGVIYASAAVHAGWDDPSGGRIPHQAGEALHAFAIVGYDSQGFYIQNSWGENWGENGLAHWSYRDWAANIQDAWVLQLAIPAPDAFGLVAQQGAVKGGSTLPTVRNQRPSRTDIAGHFVHVENGSYSGDQPYWSSKDDVAATANLLAASDKYEHLLFYAHGGLNTTDAAATRIAAMAPVFMANGIYPYGIIYDTGLAETLGDVILGRGQDITARTGGLLDLSDDLIERAVGRVGKSLWREMKRDATLPFEPRRDGEGAIKTFVSALQERRQRGRPEIALHLVGHSTGAIVVGRLLAALDRTVPAGMSVSTCSLMAPACTVDFYNQAFRPRLQPNADKPVKLSRATVYNLTDPAEQDDSVATIYRKSLLYLVSNAFEEEKRAPILGMQRYSREIEDPNLEIFYAGRNEKRCQSTTHGGFDNDPATMNDILVQVLGRAPSRPFSQRDLDYS